MASITFNRGVVSTFGQSYVVRAHNTDADASSNNSTASTFVQATFLSRGKEITKRQNSEKVLSYSGGKYLERLRNIRTQKEVVLTSGAITSTDSDAIGFITHLLKRSLIWVSKDNGTTWLQAYCSNDNFETIDLNEFKEFVFNIIFAEIEEAN